MAFNFSPISNLYCIVSVFADGHFFFMQITLFF